MIRTATVLALLLAGPALAAAQNPREKKVRDDKVKVEADGLLDLQRPAQGVRRGEEGPASRSSSCCAASRARSASSSTTTWSTRTRALRPLLEKFVRVRVVSTNGLDLSLFQFDYDQSFAVFFLNADGTIYGRFGTRSHRTNWVGDVSVDGLAKALQGALDLHADYPKNKDALAAKRGPAPQFAGPEKFPSLRRSTGRSWTTRATWCRAASTATRSATRSRTSYRDEEGADAGEVLFPYPHPKSLGLILDPKERATVLKVETGSDRRRRPGFKAGRRDPDAERPAAALHRRRAVGAAPHARPTAAKLKAEVVARRQADRR